MEPQSVEEALALLAERPDDIDLLQELGRLYLRNGQPELARETYERALAIDPDDPWTHLYMGNWCYRANKLRDALKWFRRAAELLPMVAIVHTCQGDIYWKQGEYELADEAYRKARQIDPDERYTRKQLQKWYQFRYGDEVR